MLENILKILNEKNIKFELFEHCKTKSCEDSKKIRETLGLEGIGSKNIVFHAKGNFYLVTTIGQKDIKARNFKKEFGTKDIRFATGEEIMQNLNAVIGSIAPFGFKNEEIKIFVDREIFENKYFMFNPFDPEKTIKIETSDLKKIYDSLKNKVTYFDFREEQKLFFENI